MFTLVKYAHLDQLWLESISWGNEAIVYSNTNGEYFFQEKINSVECYACYFSLSSMFKRNFHVPCFNFDETNTHVHM